MDINCAHSMWFAIQNHSGYKISITQQETHTNAIEVENETSKLLNISFPWCSNSNDAETKAIAVYINNSTKNNLLLYIFLSYPTNTLCYTVANEIRTDVWADRKNLILGVDNNNYDIEIAVNFKPIAYRASGL